MKDIFSSSRYFVLHDYWASHGQLLLRSKAIDRGKTIDIIFSGTTYIQSYVSFNGIIIKRLEVKEHGQYQTVNTFLKYPNNYIFLLESNNEQYFIAASFVNIFENDLEFNKSSLQIENDKGVKIANG